MVPILVVATTSPAASVERIEVVMPVSHVEPALEKPLDVEAFVKKVVDARTMVSLSHSGVVVL